MVDVDSVDEWNSGALSLVGALLGAISPNFRMVVIDRKDGIWILVFLLEKDDDVDRAEIANVGTKFAEKSSSFVDYRTEILVDETGMPFPLWPARAVYCRRER